MAAGTGINIINNTISAKNDFYLGQDTLAGIVYYIYIGKDGQQHGLIVSKTYEIARWQNTGILTGADRSWDGFYNTNLMSDSPAKDWITNNFSSEWYLPSIDELSLLYNSCFFVNKALTEAGINEIGSIYWSSSEVFITTTKIFDFTFATENSMDKTVEALVRAIRAF